MTTPKEKLFACENVNRNFLGFVFDKSAKLNGLGASGKSTKRTDRLEIVLLSCNTSLI